MAKDIVSVKDTFKNAKSGNMFVVTEITEEVCHGDLIFPTGEIVRDVLIFPESLKQMGWERK
jgi:hypothetical protein